MNFDNFWEVAMKRLTALLLIVVFSTAAFAQTYGSMRLIHTQTGRTFTKGRLDVNTNLSFFTKLGEYIGTPPPNFSASNMWLITNNIVFTYGILDNLDVTAAIRMYQDTHYSNEYNLPDDIFLNIKAASFAFGDRHFYGGGILKFRFGTGEVANYPFQEYSSGGIEYGVMGVLSYHADQYLPDRDFSAHLNVGWYTHNDAGKEVYPGQKAGLNATELQFGLGFVYPVGEIDFMLEANGINYIDQPDTMVYSRESWLYVTPSIRYKPYHWFSADVGVDISLASDNNTTIVRRDPRVNLDLPTYASWRAYIGLNFKILPIGSGARTPEEVERDRFNQRIDFFQNIIEERERAEKVQEELDRLKREREEAEKELEELKQVLEEEG